MTLPAEKLNELKQMIHNHLDRMDIHGRIRECVSESLRDREEDSGDVSEEGLIRTIQEKGIVEDVMRGLQFKRAEDLPIGSQSIHHSPEKRPRSQRHAVEKDHMELPLDPNKRYLYLQICGGKAFLEHLQDPEPLPGRATSTFKLHVKFREHRFTSQAVPCSCDPDIQEGFLIEVQKHPKDPGKLSDAPSLLSVSEKIHLVLTKEDRSGDSCLLASHFMDWRRILAVQDGRSSFSLELNGIGAENNVPVGILEIKLSLIPKLSKRLTSDVIAGQLNLEKSRWSERERLFLAYSKQWWREYLQIRQSHSNRLVKIFAQDENGIHKHVSSFVQPLRGARLIDTPRQAARFVSLIGYDRMPPVGGTRSEMWTNTHAFLCAGKGDVENHSILLCSLLLGFGLNAYVCIGTKSKGVAHSWVATIGTDGTTVFWDSLTAQRFIHHPIDPNSPPAVQQPAKAHSYVTIGCAFNNREFYANCQPSDKVDFCRFEFSDESLWKGMSLDAIKSICGPGIVPAARHLITLVPSKIDPIFASNALENELRALVVDHRNSLGLGTQWDDELSYFLSPALAAYENEHCLGISVGNEEFQHAIRRNVPDGHTFKGFPIQFAHRNATRIFNTCIKSAVCDEIIRCRGDQVRLAVRARVFPYPEETNAVWIMFAVKYKSIQ